MTQTERQYENAKKRRVGFLNDAAVYFVGSRIGFHLAVEDSPGELRRLSESEHLRFKQQSRVKGLPYGTAGGEPGGSGKKRPRPRGRSH